MMYRLLLLLLIGCVFGCNQNLIIEAQDIKEPSLAYYLEFDINTIDYQNPEGQDTTHVYANQDLTVALSFQDLATTDRYLYFAGYDEPSADSVVLLGQIRFLLDEDTPFEHDVFDLEFVFTEALSNLTPNPDGGYDYTDNQVFATRLSQQNWGNTSLFTDATVSQLLLTVPDANTEMEGWDLSMFSSNGFYFPHEQLEFSSITFHEENNTVELVGEFAVELKILSCGFYSFYNVSNASFRALIQ